MSAPRARRINFGRDTANRRPPSESDINHDLRNQSERDNQHNVTASGCDIGSKATKQDADNYGIASSTGAPAFENEALRPNVVALAHRTSRSTTDDNQNLS